MKSSYLYIFLALISVFSYSCKNELADEIGTSIQPKGDVILVNGSSFELSTRSYPVERIYNNPDSFLLGRFENEIYGPLSAEILTQFNVPFSPETPSDKRFPANSEIDSVKLVLFYNSWFGSESTPINLKVYRMNGNSMLDFNTTYPSDININKYVNPTQENLLGEKTFTAKDMLGKLDSTYIAIKLDQNSAFVEDLFNLSQTFSSTEEFLSAFKGLYLKTELTDATLLYISSIRLIMYYKYQDSNSGTHTSTRTLAASKDVGKANRLTYERTPEEFEVKINEDDAVNYISSPANVYTKVTIPLKEIAKNMLDSIENTRKLIVNSAKIKINAILDEGDSNSDNLTLSPPSHMLLMEMEMSKIQGFLGKGQDTFDNNITYSSYSTTDSCYTFDIAPFLTEKFFDKNGNLNYEGLDELLEMYLVPVSVSTSTTQSGTAITNVKHQETMSSVKIRSGKNERPMKITVIYSGF